MIRNSRADDTTPERQGGQHHLPQIAQRIVEERGKAAGGQQAKLEGKDEHQKRGQPEIGNGAENGRDGRDHAVGKAQMAIGGERPERNGNQIGDDEGEQRELQRHRQPLQDLRADLDAILEGPAEVAGERLAEPFEILDVQGAVEPVQGFEPHDRLRRGVDAEGRAGRRAGHDVDGDEQDERGDEKGRHEQRQPGENEADHGAASTWRRSRREAGRRGKTAPPLRC